MLPQCLELRDVDFLDIGEMWNLALRRTHSLGDKAAKTDDFDFCCRGVLRDRLGKNEPAKETK